MLKKKVKDCTIKELEKYFVKEYGFKTNRIEIYRDSISFLQYISGSLFCKVVLTLEKEEEIEIGE